MSTNASYIAFLEKELDSLRETAKSRNAAEQTIPSRLELCLDLLGAAVRGFKIEIEASQTPKKAPKKAPAKATAAMPLIDPEAKGAKTAFIRANPTMGVTALVAAAAEQGIRMSKALVYSIRSSDKKKAPAWPPPAAAKKTASKPAVKSPAVKSEGHGSKSAFVRSLPPDTPVPQVLKLAAEQGIRMSKALVYSIRSSDKKKAPATTAKKAPATTAKKAATKKSTTAKKAPAKKAPAKKSTGKARAKNNQKAAEGRRAVARGERPPMKIGMAIIMGDKTMNAQEVVDGLTAKGWAPESDDPKGYVSYMLSSTRSVFERDDSKGRGYYRVKDGVSRTWTPVTPVPVPAPTAAAVAKPNGNGAKPAAAKPNGNGNSVKAKANGESAEPDLIDLGITESETILPNPFDP